MNGYFPVLAKEHRVTTECVKVETCTTLMRSVLPVQWKDRGKVSPVIIDSQMSVFSWIKRLLRRMKPQKTIGDSFVLWSEILDGQAKAGEVDPNSVAGVIFAAVREMAVFNAYKVVCENNASSPLNTPLFRMSYVRDYLYIQGTRIRKLTERGGKPLFADKNTDVYSLGRLLDDMLSKIKSGELTREGIAKHFGIPESKAKVERLANGPTGTTSVVDMTFASIEHGLIDGLCNKSGQISLKSKVAKELKKRVLPDQNKDIQAINSTVNKLIVHAASVDSRAELEQLTYSTQNIENAIQGLAEAYLFLNSFIRRSGLSSVLPFGLNTHLVGLPASDQKVANAAIEDIQKRRKVGRETLRLGQAVTKFKQLEAIHIVATD